MFVYWGEKLTSTCPVKHLHVAVLAVALVASISVHAPVFTGPGLQTALIQVCGHRERESVSGQQDRETLHRGEISQRAKVLRSVMSNLTHPFMYGVVCLCVR